MNMQQEDNARLDALTPPEDIIEIKDTVSGWLKVLAPRIHIFSFLLQKPRSANEIMRQFGTSNADVRSNKLGPLIEKGFVKIIREGSDDGSRRIIQKYVAIQGQYEALMRHLSLVSNLNIRFEDHRINEIMQDVNDELNPFHPRLKVLGGKLDGTYFRISAPVVNIGRGDRNQVEEGIVLDAKIFPTVTRISQPHAQIRERSGRYFIVDCKSKNGTFLNHRKLGREQENELHDEDIINFSTGSGSGTFLFLMPNKEMSLARD